MDQKAIAKAPIKTDRIELIQENPDRAFFESGTREVDLKSLNQAIHNLDLGIDFLQKVDAAYGKVESLLYQIKQLAAPGLESNLDCSGNPEPDKNISLKKQDITTQLKQRSKSLNILLQEIKQYQDISIANHKAAKSAPDSVNKAKEFLRTISLLT
tara:strand:+ start:238 stop:705 length:468 start_codon:yes stop_codon:yes gene_type:complete